MFSMMVFFGFHWDSEGLAAARIDVLAFGEQERGKVYVLEK